MRAKDASTMNVILLGATGMIGQGVLRECLADPDVARVLSLGRSKSGQEHPKLTDLLHADLLDLTSIEEQLKGYDACFFCLGVSSAGLSEAEYRKVTFEYTLSVARTLARLNPGMTFEYISGAGTDGTERGRTMWARVKGATENALLALPFRAAYMFRPGYIQPLHGIRARAGLYRVMYTVMAPLYPVWRTLFPSVVTTTERLGRAMIAAARHGAPKQVLEVPDINALAPAPSAG
jgi:uncharacterized protein YbjT (DUF2867 family)